MLGVCICGHGQPMHIGMRASCVVRINRENKPNGQMVVGSGQPCPCTAFEQEALSESVGVRGS